MPVFEIIMSLTKIKVLKKRRKKSTTKGICQNVAMIARSMFLSASPSYMNMQSLISIPFF
jgi:hypothetical protein